MAVELRIGLVEDAKNTTHTAKWCNFLAEELSEILRAERLGGEAGFTPEMCTFVFMGTPRINVQILQ